MPAICLYFQVHQPRRLRKFQAFDIGQGVDYFADYTDGINTSNPDILAKVANKCYKPANQTFLKLLKEHPELKITYSITGVFLRQLQEHMPQLLESFQELAQTGQVEFLAETYYHSLSSVYSEEEFVDQIDQHLDTIEELFGQRPTVLRNTELIYNNEVGRVAKDMGFQAILAEGADKVLGWRSANYAYQAPSGIPILMKNYRLSDDIAFRFSHEGWEHHPLSANKFANWLEQASGDVVNLFLDYETFGEHQWADKGIFEFLDNLPEAVLQNTQNRFVTPSEAATQFKVKETLDVPQFTSWADQERDLSAWLENDMQKEAANKIYAMRDRVLATNDEEIIDIWRHLQTSDHFYYMCTKWAADGDVHAYFSPYESPYTAFLSYMNILQDFDLKLQEFEENNAEQQIAAPLVELNVG